MTADIAAAYKSGSQRARVVTEFWGEHNLYCPNCSSPKLNRLVANTKASDFFCPACKFWYQLKGQKSRIGNSISDGAYEAMMAAIRRDETPSFYFMQYDVVTWSVKNLLLIPHFAFPPSAIVKRNPLAETARRAGWIGCNIALNRIPPDARIAIVATMRSPSPLRSGGEGRDEEARSAQREEVIISPPEEVRAQFRKVKPLKDISIAQRGWTLDVLNFVAAVCDRRKTLRLQNWNTFTNQDIYAFERELEQLHPDNRHIKDKIRQQLQNLARAGFLIHAGRNDYRVK